MLTRGSKPRQLYPTKIIGIKLFVLDLPRVGLVSLPSIQSIIAWIFYLPPAPFVLILILLVVARQLVGLSCSPSNSSTHGGFRTDARC